MKRSFRALSHLLVPTLCCCIIITALTGIFSGLSDRLLSLPTIIASILIAIHQGAFLGSLSTLYVIFVGLGVFFLGLKIVISGQYNLLFQLAHPRLVNICRAIALVLVIPVAICAETGVAYRLATDWFNISKSQTASLLAIHSGIALETMLGIGYILIAGSGLIIMSILGWQKGNSYFKQQQLRQDIKQKFEQAYLAEDFVPNSVNRINRMGSERQFRLLAGSFVCLSLFLLYWLTSLAVVAIAIVVALTIVSLFLLWKRSVDGEQSGKVSTKLYEHEAESITMLKAIPDSMLRITQDGICCSYMPAKEASDFVLHGDIIGRHVSEFIASEIATGLINGAQVSLATGKTQLFQFPIKIDNQSQLYEARISNIGEIEVLVLIREIEPQMSLKSNLTRVEDVPLIELHTEADLLETLETAVQNVDRGDRRQNEILVCLAIDESKTATSTVAAKENLLQQTATIVSSSFPATTIFLLEDDNLVLLVDGLTAEQISATVDDLHHNLQEFSSTWSQDADLLEFKIGLLEVDPDHLNATSTADFAIAMVDAAKATCQMAKQKVNLKTFW